MLTPLNEKTLFLCVFLFLMSISLASESASDDYNEVLGVFKGKQSLRLRVRKLLVQGHVSLLLWSSSMHIIDGTSTW